MSGSNRSDPGGRVVLAGGGVVFRQRPGKSREVLLIHRDRYRDWTLPKGKVEPGESVVAAAAREIQEETGVTVRLGVPLNTVRYPLNSGNTKEVRYWAGQPQTITKRPPDDEVDLVDWVTPKEALRQLTFKRDRDLVRQALEQPHTTALLLVRHGKAVDRDSWSGPDLRRPLAPHGRNQARQLVEYLASYGIERLVTSPANRCVATLRPYAKQYGVQIETRRKLTEESAAADPAAVSRLIAKLRQSVVAKAQPTAICIHRPVLPAILKALELPTLTLAPAEMLVAHLTAAEVQAIERHHPEPDR